MPDSTKDQVGDQEDDYGRCFGLDDSWEALVDLTMKDLDQEMIGKKKIQDQELQGRMERDQDGLGSADHDV